MASYTAVLLSKTGVAEVVIPEPHPVFKMHRPQKRSTWYSRAPQKLEQNGLAYFKRISVYPLPGQVIFYEEIP